MKLLLLFVCTLAVGALPTSKPAIDLDVNVAHAMQSSCRCTRLIERRGAAFACARPKCSACSECSSTTAAPTTEASTTEAPTEAPTTEAPTTEAPTTEVPTTEAPTEAPTTEAPTEAPTTEAPSASPAPAAFNTIGGVVGACRMAGTPKNYGTKDVDYTAIPKGQMDCTACTAECSSRDDCVAIECNDKKLWCEIWHNMPTGSAAMSGYECLAKP